MKKSLMLFLVAAMGLVACNNFEKAPSGTLYKIHKSEGKTKIKEGDYVRMELVQTVDGDSLLHSSYDNETPAVFQLPKKTYAGDMFDVLTNFGEGDSVTFKLDIDSMATYTKQPRPAELKGKYIVFNVKINKVLSKNAGEADTVFAKRAGEFFKKEYDALILKKKDGEMAKIKAYIEEHKLDAKTTASGLRYVIQNPGNGEKGVAGDTLSVKYVGKFTKKRSNGKDNIFDTNDMKTAKDNDRFNPMASYGATDMVIGGPVIPGMNEALAMLSAGAKAIFIMPSALAYGEHGAAPQVPPYSPLVFEVEILKLKKATTKPAPPAPVTP